MALLLSFLIACGSSEPQAAVPQPAPQAEPATPPPVRTLPKKTVPTAPEGVFQQSESPLEEIAKLVGASESIAYELKGGNPRVQMTYPKGLPNRRTGFEDPLRAAGLGIDCEEGRCTIDASNCKGAAPHPRWAHALSMLAIRTGQSFVVVGCGETTAPMPTKSLGGFRSLARDVEPLGGTVATAGDTVVLVLRDLPGQ